MTRDSWKASGVVIGIGGVLTGIHLFHGLEEIGDAIRPVLYGVGLPLLVSTFIIASGVWMYRREWNDVKPWRPVAWFIGGGAIGIVLIELLVLYQHAEGVTLADQEFVIPMFGTYGGAVGLLLGYYDIQRQLHRARQQRRTRRLDNFASYVSHDLRSPLSVAEGHLELAREECDSDHLEEVARSHDRMETLIEDLLALARADETTIDPEPIAVASLAEQCWKSIPSRSATLQVDTDLAVQADRSQLQQLLENLIRNAIEHGGEDVTVRIGELPNGQGFYVEDDGPGIPKEDRNRVVESGYSTNAEGTGFGLAIVNSVVQAHDWTLTVTESDSGGARFEITEIEPATD